MAPGDIESLSRSLKSELPPRAMVTPGPRMLSRTMSGSNTAGVYVESMAHIGNEYQPVALLGPCQPEWFGPQMLPRLMSRFMALPSQHLHFSC